MVRRRRRFQTIVQDAQSVGPLRRRGLERSVSRDSESETVTFVLRSMGVAQA